MTWVVVDTNVLVSALLSRTGNESAVLALLRSGLLRPVFSPEVMAEYREVLNRIRFDRLSADVNELLGLIVGSGKLIEPSG